MFNQLLERRSVRSGYLSVGLSRVELIKYNELALMNVLCSGVVNSVNSRGVCISNEDTLPRFVLKLLPLLLWDMDICRASPYSVVFD